MVRGALVTAPSICCFPVPLILGFSKIRMWLVGFVLGFSNLAGPIQHYKSAIIDARKDRVAASLCAREGLRGRPLHDATGTVSGVT